MNTVDVDYDTIHTIVDSNKNLFWDGWSVVETKIDKDAMFKSNAVFRNGRWLKVLRVIDVSDQGTWRVSQKYVMGK